MKIITRRKHQRGAVSILVAILLFVLIGVLGLALDSGLGYMTRAKLDAALDGAAIAAGEAVSRGANQSEQIANAQQAAVAYFGANYPVGYLGSTATLQTPSIVFDQTGTVTINVAAQAQVPVTFMQTYGFSLLNVAASSVATRKDLDMVFVIDTTGSMNTTWNGTSVPAAVRANAISFLNNFNVTQDRVALMHFAYGTQVDQPFNGNTRGFNLAAMTSAISGYNFKDSTNSSEAIFNALYQLDVVVTQPSSQRVIVFFSDGAPNSFASVFPTTSAYTAACKQQDGTIATADSNSTPAGLYADNIQSQQLNGTQPSQQQPAPNCYSSRASNVVASLPAAYNAHPASGVPGTFPIITNTPRPVTSTVNFVNVNNASRNLLEEMAAEARAEGIFVFTLGYGPELVEPEGANGELGEDVLKCMANTPDSLARCYTPSQPVGVFCYAATPADLGPCYEQLASQILRITK
ncbi:VWA domain-containing protein [Paraburkholderia sp. DHOC27]|uniref:VWA domain-containing protein n=1 Tax=Paraburkholderia sp. DHOC27 TaxID=2303330 RepID=UPI000E3BEEAB|nr:VWA domain-containing protein [Paraburkholderia sp. DHOC27]RFU44612.1 VWA domain-containing protein [Paraburkholderia sp. DHOC27]